MACRFPSSRDALCRLRRTSLTTHHTRNKCSEWADPPVIVDDHAFPGISPPTTERARHSRSPAELHAQLRAQGFSILSRSVPWRPSPLSCRSRPQSRRSSSRPSLVLLFFLFSLLVVRATLVMIGHHFKTQFFDGSFFGRVVARQRETSYHVVKVFFRLRQCTSVWSGLIPYDFRLLTHLLSHFG